MARLGRYALNLLTATSLLLALGLVTCAVLHRDPYQWPIDFVYRHPGGAPYHVQLGRSLFIVRRGPSVTFMQGDPIPAWFSAAAGKPVHVQFAGFKYENWIIGSGGAYRETCVASHWFTVPLWFLLAATLALPAGRGVAAVRRRRRRDADDTPRCNRCGYDLRATPIRCPECGAVA